MKKWLIGILFLIIVFFSFIYIVYNYGEEKAYKQMRASCELSDIVKLLNKYYKLNNQYPDKRHWVQSISSGFSEVRCGRHLTIKNGTTFDLWNDEYNYEPVSEKSINFYSKNLTTTFILLEGKVQKIEDK